MKCKGWFCLIFILYSGILAAQNKDWEQAVLRICGCSVIEELSADEIELYQLLHHRPLKLNSATQSELQQSGLLSTFQIASLLDYRARHGLIMSLTELASVDGFGADFVSRLAPFIRLETSYESLSNKKSSRFLGEVSTRGFYKTTLSTSVGHASAGAVKMKCSILDILSLSFSCSKPYDFKGFNYDLLGGNISVDHKVFKIIIGDFIARFGQGLCLWNTMTVNSLTSPSALMLRPAGFSSAYSFSGTSSLTGIAADISFGKWSAASGVYSPEIKSEGFQSVSNNMTVLSNIQRIGRLGHVGATHIFSFFGYLPQYRALLQMRSALDFAICANGINIYGEMAFDWRMHMPALVSGVDFTPDEHIRLATRLRYIPYSDEHSAVFVGEYTTKEHKLTAAVEGLYHPDDMTRQYRIQTDWFWAPVEKLQLKVRLSERIRTWGNHFRTDFRTDFCYDNGVFVSNLRVNGLWSESFSVLSYIEAGYKTKRLTLYLREGIFAVDNWNDRIYVYERDAPGNFNIPALYGRGVWTSIYMSWRFFHNCRLYCRSSYMSYPFMKKRKPGKAELKFMFTVRF